MCGGALAAASVPGARRRALGAADAARFALLRHARCGPVVPGTAAGARPECPGCVWPPSGEGLVWSRHRRPGARRGSPPPPLGARHWRRRIRRRPELGLRGAACWRASPTHARSGAQEGSPGEEAGWATYRGVCLECAVGRASGRERRPGVRGVSGEPRGKTVARGRAGAARARPGAQVPSPFRVVHTHQKPDTHPLHHPVPNALNTMERPNVRDPHKRSGV